MEIEFSISVKVNNKVFSQKYPGQFPVEEKNLWITINGDTEEEINKKFLVNCYAVLAKARNPKDDDKFQKDLIHYKEKLKTV